MLSADETVYCVSGCRSWKSTALRLQMAQTEACGHTTIGARGRCTCDMVQLHTPLLVSEAPIDYHSGFCFLFWGLGFNAKNIHIYQNLAEKPRGNIQYILKETT